MNKNESGISRRDFIKISVIGGITVYLGVKPIHSIAQQALTLDRVSWTPTLDVKPAQRIDAVAKVTGAKVFARDVRAKDMPGWPVDQSYALILRVASTDRLYLGLDLSSLPLEAKPNRVVTAEDLKRDQLDFPAFYTKHMLLPEGERASILGQAVAILIFNSYAQYREAKTALRFRTDIFKFSDATTPLAEFTPWGALRSIRVSGKEAQELYSPLKNGWIRPLGYSRGEPVWPEPDASGHAAARGMAHAHDLDRLLLNSSESLFVLKRSYRTQSTDAVTLETENANCWYDPQEQALHMVVSVQNPEEVLTHSAAMVKACAFPVKAIYVQPTFTVSYGAKDSSNHTYYALVAALYGNGRPVQTVLDRYEHFQAALKRHPFEMEYTLAVDPRTGDFQALRSHLQANGGGRPSFSNVVIQESTIQSTGIYQFPISDLTGIAQRSRALDASAIRGFGNLQTMSGLEMLVDELAHQLKRDPIALRIQNAMRTGMRNSQGGVPSGHLRIVDVLNRAATYPLWTEREKHKLAFEQANPKALYGVGVAIAQKNFGTGGEAAFAKVELDPQGRIKVYHCGVETGTGLATTQAVVCAEWLGRSAHEVQTGVTDWSDIPMESTGNAFDTTQEFEDHAQKNPRWTPRFVSSSGATNTAYYFTHATRMAARVIAQYGIWPAALDIWGAKTGGGQLSTEQPGFAQARWVEGHLTASGMEPLAWSQLVTRAYEMGMVTGAAVHSFNRWRWAQADYLIGDVQVRLPLDGLSVKYGNGQVPGSRTADTPNLYSLLKRQNMVFPPVQRYRGGPTLTSAVASVVALSVQRDSGEVNLLDHHTILECGRVMVPELVEGQVQGGTAMGIGFALYEELPLYEDGPGNGQWNFDRYRLPRAQDVAVWKQSIEILAPLSDSDPPKGFSEAAVIPVAPAIGNAIAHACGKRLYEFPMTASKIKEQLL